jgi:hypothetical protein
VSGGSVRVSFAGTFAEAVEWCRSHPLIKAPKGLSHHGDDCLPMLTIVYRNSDERCEAHEVFKRLGWPIVSHITVPHGHGFHGDRH